MNTSTTDILLMIFPRIMGRLKQLYAKFNVDMSKSVEQKKDKIHYSTPAVASLLTHFPHQYESYASCVDSFVSIAKNSPESGISVLLTLLPKRKGSTLYENAIKEIVDYEKYENLYDLFITLFFADCVAQILTVNPKTQYEDQLLNLCYEMISPFQNSYEEPLRISIIKQFSVILSLLSINNLDKILNNFQIYAPDADPSLFFLLHRFVRLSSSVDISKILAFLTNFHKMNPYDKEFQKIFLKVKKNKENEAKFASCWAESLYYLVTQINVSEATMFIDILNSIYTTALSKATSKPPSLYHVMLCSSIVMRIQNTSKKNYKEFMNDVILKSKDVKYLEASLYGFLIIIRGPYCSRSAFFWEWGSFNAHGRLGIEATHLFNPEEDQSHQNSFTSMFLSHFGQLPIEQYPKVVGDILLNLAARDFPYFIQKTIPNLISHVGPNNAIICLQKCLQMIIDPNRQFAEWAQNNPRNTSQRIGMLIPLIFNYIKNHLFSTIQNLIPKSTLERYYCFELTDSKDFPRFSLPFSTEPFPHSSRQRIGNSTIKISKVLEHWGYKDYQIDQFLEPDTSIVQTISNEEAKLIPLLEFIPRVVNASDLINGFGYTLISSVLSGSKAISYFSIRVINQIFSANDNSRILIYGFINRLIRESTSSVHIFMLLQLLVKLFDLSLEIPKASGIAEEFINGFQPSILYTLTFASSEIRDLAIQLIERLTKFGSTYNVNFPLNIIFSKFNPTISAVARYNIIRTINDKPDSTIPSSLISLKEASISNYSNLYRFFFIEIVINYSHLVNVRILIDTIDLFIKMIPQHPGNANNANLFIHYSYMLNGLLYLLPITIPSNHEHKLYLEKRLTPFYDFPSIHSNLSKDKRDILSDNAKSITDILQVVLSKISNELSNEDRAISLLNIKLLSYMNATAISNFLPIFNKWVTDNQNNSAILVTASDIIKNISKLPDFGLCLLAYEKAKVCILAFCNKIQNYIEDIKLTSDFNKFDASRGDFEIVINYTDILKNFADGLFIQPPPINEGPIKAFEIDKWILDKWSIESKQKTLEILLKWSRLSQMKDQSFSTLGEHSLNSLGSFARFSPIFDKNLQFQGQIEKIIVSLEQINQNISIGNLYLPRILSNNRQYLYSKFIGKVFNDPPEASLHYFIAIALLYYIDIDNSFLNKLGFDVSSNVIPTVSSIKKVKSSRTVSRSFSNANFLDFFSSDLSKEDIDMNRELLQHSPQLILSCLIYLTHKQIEVRRIAFKLLQRILPIIKTILVPNDSKSVGQMMSKLRVLSNSFYSNITTTSHDIIIEISTLIAKELNFLSDNIIHEVLTRISSAKPDAFLSNSTAGLLLKLCKPIFRNQSLYDLNRKKDWDQRLVIFNPFSFLICLLHVSPQIENKDIGYYLAIWEQFATHKENVTVIIDYLLDIGQNTDCINGIKMVLIAMAKLAPDIVINSLVSRLTYAFWFRSSLQGRMKSKSAPKPIRASQLERVILTLSELIQPYFERIKPHIPILLNFSLLYLDESSNYLSDLLLIIMACYPKIPGDFLDSFVPPSSVVWSSEYSVSDPSMGNEFTDVDVALRSFNKNPISVPQFVRKLVRFFKDNHNDDFIQEWGNEAIKWAAGCSDLLIAGRAAYIFAEILDPINQDIIMHIAVSLSNVANIEKQTELTRYYISACLSLFSSFFMKFQNDEDELFTESFMLLFQIAAAFLCFQEDETLCQKALAIAAEFAMNVHCENCEIKKLLKRLSSLASSLQSTDSLFAAILAIFYREKDNSPSSISNCSLYCLLPFVYMALSAYQNIQPFASEMSDNKIANMIQILNLISSTSSFPVSLRDPFSEIFKDPSLIDPDEFILNCCSSLSEIQGVTLSSSSYLCKAALNSHNDTFLSSCFAVVRGILQSPKADAEIVSAYSPIARIAAFHSSPQAESLLQVYLQKMPAALNVSNQIPNISSDSSQPATWSDISNKLEECVKSIQIKLPKSDTNLNEPLVILPIDPSNWDTERNQKLRSQFESIHVVDHIFVDNEALFEEINNTTTSPESLDKFEIPDDSNIYFSFTNSMNDFKS